MPITFHLSEGDYSKYFPTAPDEFPIVINEEHFIDAWLLNTAFNSIQGIEEYLIDHQDNIEAPLGDDVIGEDGRLEISIPYGFYRGYKFAMAWDSNLLEENIKLGEVIFGVTGTLTAAGGGVLLSVPIVTKIDNAWVYVTPSVLSKQPAIPTLSVPAVSAA